jgi:acetyl esterase/lipase
MKRVLFGVLLLSFQLHSQESINLWDGDPPYSKPSSLEEMIFESWGVQCVKNVTVPTLTIYEAAGEQSGHAMIVCPGGGYEVESFIAEGQLIAEYLANQGITAAVLKYRLPNKEISDQPHLLPATDAHRAIRVMKSMAEHYGIKPNKVGIMGFSAGGHLATTVSVHRSDNADENPDFSALIYPVTTLGDANQKWLEESLYHRPMTDKEKKHYSLVNHVSEKTPPAFLLHAYDDGVVPIEESILYAEALNKVGQAVEVHFFAHGDHGFGPGRASDGTDQWLALLANWIKRQ